jgi:putative DNA primase/helicase
VTAVVIPMESTGDLDPKVAPDPTEDALALAFTKRHAQELRYVHEWGKWLRWDGRRWAEERTLHVFDLARDLTREIGDGLKARARARIESSSTVAAIVTLARAG